MSNDQLGDLMPIEEALSDFQEVDRGLAALKRQLEDVQRDTDRAMRRFKKLDRESVETAQRQRTKSAPFSRETATVVAVTNAEIERQIAAIRETLFGDLTTGTLTAFRGGKVVPASFWTNDASTVGITLRRIDWKSWLDRAVTRRRADLRGFPTDFERPWWTITQAKAWIASHDRRLVASAATMSSETRADLLLCVHAGNPALDVELILATLWNRLVAGSIAIRAAEMKTGQSGAPATDSLPHLEIAYAGQSWILRHQSGAPLWRDVLVSSEAIQREFPAHNDTRTAETSSRSSSSAKRLNNTKAEEAVKALIAKHEQDGRRKVFEQDILECLSKAFDGRKGPQQQLRNLKELVPDDMRAAPGDHRGKTTN